MEHFLEIFCLYIESLWPRGNGTLRRFMFRKGNGPTIYLDNCRKHDFRIVFVARRTVNLSNTCIKCFRKFHSNLSFPSVISCRIAAERSSQNFSILMSHVTNLTFSKYAHYHNYSFMGDFL